MAKPKGRGSRRSRAESSTGTKEGAVETRTPGLDLVVLDDGDFDLHFRSLKAAIERQKQAKNLYDGVCKAAKRVSADLLDAIKSAAKFEGRAPSDIKRQLEIDGYALKRTGGPIQLTVFDTLEGDQDELVYKRGFDAGKAGRSPDNQYPEGSDLHEIYARGWRHGTADNMGVSPEDSDKAYAESLGDAEGKDVNSAASEEVTGPVH